MIGDQLGDSLIKNLVKANRSKIFEANWIIRFRDQTNQCFIEFFGDLIIIEDAFNNKLTAPLHTIVTGKKEHEDCLL